VGLLVFLFFIGALRIKFTGKTLSSFGILIGSYIYTSVFPLIIFILRQESHGIFLIYILFLLAWFNDAIAYFIGSFFGKSRGIIRFSPNKSLEGYAGSFIFTLALGILLRFIFAKRFPFNTMQAAYAGLLIAVCAPLGDLLESLLKRKAGVKDSSNLFPGLGGVLDVFDSILMSAPFYYLLIKIGFKM
jgi:phosphatidate cytidylyltransferase